MAFHYDPTTFTIRDDERGLVVTQAGSPGHGIYGGDLQKDEWGFHFTVARFSDEWPNDMTGEQILDSVQRERLRNPDFRVQLIIRIYPMNGKVKPPDAVDLAREAAIAREVEFMQTEACRITTNC